MRTRAPRRRSIPRFPAAVLAWMVVDSTSNGPNDDIVILHADVWSQIHVEA